MSENEVLGIINAVWVIAGYIIVGAFIIAFFCIKEVGYGKKH